MFYEETIRNRQKSRFSQWAKMKVLVVSSSFPLNIHTVTASFVFDEASKSSRRDIVIHVARGVKSIWNKERDLFVENMSIHNFGRKIDPLIVLSTIKNALALLPISNFHPEIIATTLPYSWFITKLIRKHRLDLIHAHFAYPEGFAGLIAKHETGRPLIVTLHGVDILTERTIGYGLRLNKGFDIIIRKVLREADVVIASSTSTFEEALNAGCDQRNLVLVPNGVDIKRFTLNIDGRRVRKKLGIMGKFIVFTLRAHVPKNGIKYLIKAAHTVLRKNPNVYFVIGGDGPLRRELEKLADGLGISGNIVFTGYIPYDELPYYYAASDIFVIPSVIEAFGLVAVEAMACGKPVVGSNVGGIRDIIRDGQNGYLVEPKDPKSLADKIAFMLENPSLREKLGEEGRRTAERNFDIERRIDKILRIYSRLIEVS